MKVLIADQVTAIQGNDPYIQMHTLFLDGSSTIVEDNYNIQAVITGLLTTVDIRKACEAAVISYGNSQSYGLASTDVIWAQSGDNGRPSFSNPSRTMDSAFQPSTTRECLGIWSVQIVSTLSLSGGQLGSVQLQYADDSGFTTNVVTLSEAGNGNTGTLTIGLNTVQTVGSILTGVIPVGKYVRLHSVDTTGAPTQSFVRAQEVLL